MVETQLRTQDVREPRLLSAFAEVPREAYLPETLQALAYVETDLRFPNSARTMLSPVSLARLLQLADIQPHEHVLDIGCTTGYGTAIIAELALSVIGLEEDEQLSSWAHANSPMPDNADLVCGALGEGHVDGGMYDVILLEGAAQHMPSDFKLQLKPRGRLVAVMGAGHAARATVFRNSDDGLLPGQPEFNIALPLLQGFEERTSFQFAV